MMRFRAQVQGVRGWVDGALFARQKDAEKDAERLAVLYDRPTRVEAVGTLDQELPGMWENADFEGGRTDAN